MSTVQHCFTVLDTRRVCKHFALGTTNVHTDDCPASPSFHPEKTGSILSGIGLHQRATSHTKHFISSVNHYLNLLSHPRANINTYWYTGMIGAYYTLVAHTRSLHHNIKNNFGPRHSAFVRVHLFGASTFQRRQRSPYLLQHRFHVLYYTSALHILVKTVQ